MNRILAIAALALFLFSCENDLSKVKELSKEKQPLVEHARNVEILYSDSAIVRVRILAETMLNYPDLKKPWKEFPDGINVQFLNENKQETSRLSALYARFYEKEERIELRDSVELWNSIGERLETEELIWDEKTARVWSDKYVRVTTREESVWGKGFESNLEFTDWTIRNMQGRIRSDRIID